MPFAEPIPDGIIVCWSCGGRMRAPDADILAHTACIRCRHCGATIWLWPDQGVDAVDGGHPGDPV